MMIVTSLRCLFIISGKAFYHQKSGRTTFLLTFIIDDVRRFKDSKSLIAYAGIDAPPYQSGQFEGTKRHISKRGSRNLRKCGYEVMMALKSSKPTEDNVVYEYMLRKEAEGKNKKLVKIAGLNKFLRIYYARVMEVHQQ